VARICGQHSLILNRGRHAQIPLGHGLVSVPASGDFADRIQGSISRAKTLLLAAQQRMKAFADHGRRKLEFKVGIEFCFQLSICSSRTQGLTRKPLSKWIGPFKIVDQIGKVVYRLDLPANLKIHPVFHVSLI
jgi:hypothetical protein